MCFVYHMELLLLVVDVFEELSLYEAKAGDRSHKDAIQFVQKICASDPVLRKEASDALRNPMIYLAPLCADAGPLLRSMAQHNVVLGGYQATAFFYPTVQIAPAPWDFYCSRLEGNPNEFVTTLKSLTIFDTVEDISSDDGKRVVCLRSNMSGSADPVNIRVYIPKTSPYVSVLNLPMSHQQSTLGPYDAVCFWPRLTSRFQHREFRGNSGHRAFPQTATVFPTNLARMTRVSLRHEARKVSVYSSEDNRTEVVPFKNESRISDANFNGSLLVLPSEPKNGRKNPTAGGL